MAATKVPAVKGNGPAMVLRPLNDMIKAWSDYRKTCEVEKTKRARIAAERDVALAKIEAFRELAGDYFERAFSERRQVLQNAFRTLDKALESGNDKDVSMTLSAIVTIVQTSPLKDFQRVSSQIADPGVKTVDI